ncbi:MAG: signal peptidase I [Candidatus Zambryskibacteria bacterium]|nr:signal peptidase I [Candidatus Zambryskibacteria bacterium]
MTFKTKLLSVLIVAFIVSVVIKTFFIEGLIVIGDSMEPTIHSGDYVFINKFAYWNSEPERGDIVVANSRAPRREKVVKRIIGMPGERFAIEKGAIVIRATRLEEGVILSEGYLTGTSTPSVGITLIKLDPREYFALGDNREVSIDSRELGPIDLWEIKGEAFGAFNFKTFKFRFF